MYTVTFYSFKGGVGRSLSLANCAFDLVRRGKNVLVVDFDLEAPGLSSYKEFQAASNEPGIVDYVSSYVASSGDAPDVLDFIHECSSAEYGSGRIWIMPAGNPNSDYGRRLHSIDWQNLYENMDGFLMIEDMKQQWKNSLSPDYVLIDSRTGHTDIGGICTRQLPDAVVALFFPNNQNISGLKTVVDEIRQSDIYNQTRILFVPSRIPDLDDENAILHSHLDAARRALKYKRTCSPIIQYNSLDLIDEDLFVISRPKSRLAKEYVSLASDIIVGNLEDREGALLFLDRQRASLENRNVPGDISEIDAGRRGINEIDLYLDKIATIYPEDGIVLEKIAIIYTSLSNYSQAASYLNAAIEHGNDSPRVLLSRGRTLSLNGQTELAIGDFKAVLSEEASSSNEKVAAIRYLLWLDYDMLDFLPIEDIAKNIDVVDFLPLMHFELQLSVSRLKFAHRICSKLEERLVDRELEIVRSAHGLALIGLGKFEDALRYFHRGSAKDGLISEVFNYAIAYWGARHELPVRFMKRVIELHNAEPKHQSDPNYAMCLALAFAVVGEKAESFSWINESLRRIRVAPGKHLSPWRYLTVNKETFEEDLAALKQFVEDPALNTPRIFELAASQKN